MRAADAKPLERDIDRYLEYLERERQYSPHTRASYRRDLVAFAGHLDLARWADLRSAHVRAHVAALHRRGDATRSIQRALSCIRSFLKHLGRLGLVEGNVASVVRAPKTRRKLPQLLDTDQTAQLL